MTREEIARILEEASIEVLRQRTSFNHTPIPGFALLECVTYIYFLDNSVTLYANVRPAQEIDCEITTVDHRHNKLTLAEAIQRLRRMRA